jgi:hypothetical protein
MTIFAYAVRPFPQLASPLLSPVPHPRPLSRVGLHLRPLLEGDSQVCFLALRPFFTRLRLTLAILFVLRESIGDMDMEKVGLLLRDWKRGDLVFPVTTSQVSMPT